MVGSNVLGQGRRGRNATMGILRRSLQTGALN